MNLTNKGTLYYTLLHLQDSLDKKTNEEKIVLYKDYPSQLMSWKTYKSNVHFIARKTLTISRGQANLMHFITLKRENIQDLKRINELGKKPQKEMTNAELEEKDMLVKKIINSLENQFEKEVPPIDIDDKRQIIFGDKEKPEIGLHFKSKQAWAIIKKLYDNLNYPLTLEEINKELIKAKLAKKGQYNNNTLGNYIINTVKRRFLEHDSKIPIEIISSGNSTITMKIKGGKK